MQDEAALLINGLALNCLQNTPLSSMSNSIHDTAWIAMVAKEVDGRKQWLFPEAFEFLLEKQSTNGTWQAGATHIDNIVNTASGLLALLKHHQHKQFENGRVCFDIEKRIHEAKKALGELFKEWNVAKTEQVGFELIVPTLLSMLKEHDVIFSLPGLEYLETEKARKLAKLNINTIYSSTKNTLLHSLEAFGGSLDFDRISHHLANGRGVPSAYPTEIFDICWTVSTLLEAGYSKEELGSESVAFLLDYLKSSFHDMDGVFGFSRGTPADSDDTAKAIQILQLCGDSEFNVQPLLKTFASTDSFRTYPSERNPSFSANCNILKALISTERPDEYVDHINMASKFLCNTWDSGDVRDKWNLAKEYSDMLFCQALSSLLRLWDTGLLSGLDPELAASRVPTALVQVLSQAMRNQSADGSWGDGSCEISAYAIMAIISASQIPLPPTLKQACIDSATRGRRFLSLQKELWKQPRPIWIEKVSYASSLLSQTLAAAMSDKNITKYLELFSNLPLFAGLDNRELLLKAAIIEGSPSLESLNRIKETIFPSENMGSEKYLEFIPLTWTSCNMLGSPISASVLQDMMIISMLDYQADRYMEAVVGVEFKDELELISALVLRICLAPEMPVSNSNVPEAKCAPAFFEKRHSKISSTNDVSRLNEVEQILRSFVSWILSHPKRLRPGTLHDELAEGPAPQHAFQQTSFYEWVHTTGADHTSCPYSFTFFCCLIGTPGKACFPTAKQDYLARDLCRHLASLCRMYNDCGSLGRDRVECNLNSLDFDEFRSDHETDRQKRDLLWIADYEFEAVRVSLKRLEEEGVDEKTINALRLFVNVTDLYGQMYVARDMTARLN
ncbi:hypothetical protein EV356DRAFT_562567 [Viridothelium virens]|uniref:Ent-kaurene synthase n=1 Tax=Viridothelium virens TaxID=1048519 RepID=A0A6A6GRX0_VIRVR|nr:hypothetical protein EV356DRAFT_562567 [Viridothelium virens]